MDIFSKDGRLIIPISKRRAKTKKSEDKIRYVIGEAYCAKGCNLITNDCHINGYAGLFIGFKRPGIEGQLVISAIEGDFDKIILSGNLENGTKNELFCPYCSTVFEKLVNCNCTPDAEMVVIGLTPKLDFNDAVTFCNVTGCYNGTFVKSGDALRHIRLNRMI